ncbi:hypothetical protein [Hymenobacter ruricola]|uniref:Uncharacterized protein n=1 Tax=Hymenobacter ruricola TaxID=2791023 RepID=A0ABS0I4D1_9BACT|nr:hypothetical protein [Hymenobacter ruricola]MBF9221764.1 hypothetical protein [Hymenobacter ruricola]
MTAPPSPYSTWAAFYRSLQNTWQFEDGAGVNYDGTLYPWEFVRKMVREEAGQPEPFDKFITSKSFSVEEGNLEIKYENDFDTGNIRLRITGYFTPRKYLTGETWMTESYDSQAATERRFRTFGQQEAEYMARHLLSTYSLATDNY